jgi:hypothetical protein
LLAHVAAAACDVERHDDTVTGCDLGDGRSHFLDDAHRLVAEDVARLHADHLRAVEVEIGPADRTRGDADDCVRRLLDPGVVHGLDADVLVSVPHDCLHLVTATRVPWR